jgi:CHAT domain-containing protein/tetratricopeptide (TPR) repeat protein
VALTVAAVLLGATSLGAGSGVSPSTAASAEAAPQRFWDQYVWWRDLWRESPDSASAVTERTLQGNPDHFLAAWLRGQLLATTRPDSAEARRLMARADQESGAAGSLVTAATLWFAGGDAARGRRALERAHDVYARTGHPAEACRALLWKVVLRRGAQLNPEITNDLASAEAAARAFGDPDLLADVLLQRAETEYRQSAQTALQTRLEALALLSGLPAGYQLVECHRHLSNAYKTLGGLTQARQHGERALELARSLGYPRQELMGLRALAHVDRAEGALGRARARQTQAAQMARALREDEILARCYGDLGNLAREIGRHREAKEAYTEGLRSVGTEKADPGFRAMILADLAATECLLGNYRQAREGYEEALAICRARGLKLRVPVILANLAQLHLDTGNADRALAFAEEGIAAAAEAGNRRSQITLLLLKSRALQELGQGESALVAARGGRRLAREGVPHLQWDLMRREAAMLEALGRRDAADALLDTTSALFLQMPDTLELAATLRQRGEAWCRGGQAARALPLLQRSLDLLRRLRDPLQTAQTRLALGIGLLAVGRPGEAIGELEAGLKGLEDIRSSFSATEERVGFATAWYTAYADLARANIALGRPAAAFSALERGRGRGLREALSLNDAGLRARVPGELGESLATVEAEIAGLQSALREEYARENFERSPALAGLERRADSLKTIWSDLALRVESEAPGFAREVGRLPGISARDVQAALRPGEHLVAFLVGANATLIFSFAPDRMSVREIPWGEDRLARRVAEFVAALRDSAADSWRLHAGALADTLLGGEVLAGPSDRALYVLPDGALHLLPFETLLVADPRGGERAYLVEKAPVIYAESATLLLNPLRSCGAGIRPANRIPLVAFGDPSSVAGADFPASPEVSPRGGLQALRPLPNARREVEALAGLIPGARVFVGEAATEERFWEETANARMIHVASHAFVDNRHPGFSGVVLSPRAEAAVEGADVGTADGILQAHEIAERCQEVMLVTLSACESGAGRLLRGEGLLSLARAFRLLGAHNLVVSLWKVDDASAMRFMVEFYRRLAGGASPASALREAKIALLRSEDGTGNLGAGPGATQARGVGRRSVDERLSAPAAWAPFVLLGERAP